MLLSVLVLVYALVLPDSLCVCVCARAHARRPLAHCSSVMCSVQSLEGTDSAAGYRDSRAGLRAVHQSRGGPHAPGSHSARRKPRLPGRVSGWSEARDRHWPCQVFPVSDTSIFGPSLSLSLLLYVKRYISASTARQLQWARWRSRRSSWRSRACAGRLSRSSTSTATSSGILSWIVGLLLRTNRNRALGNKEHPPLTLPTAGEEAEEGEEDEGAEAAEAGIFGIYRLMFYIISLIFGYICVKVNYSEEVM